MTHYALREDTPVGPMVVTAEALGITSLRTVGPKFRAPEGWIPDPGGLGPFIAEVSRYFDGALQAFTAALAPSGTGFQRAVWEALLVIPYGETTTYGEIARRIGQPTAVRAVGAAVGRNPIAIVIPCHRVVGADGRLTGYAGGLEMKRLLLDLEAKVAQTRIA